MNYKASSTREPAALTTVIGIAAGKIHTAGSGDALTWHPTLWSADVRLTAANISMTE
jgi:hypothetical protein